MTVWGKGAGGDFLDFILAFASSDEVPSGVGCAGCYYGDGRCYCYCGCGAFGYAGEVVVGVVVAVATGVVVVVVW